MHTGEVIPWAEIDAYSRLTGWAFDHWEAGMVHSMSLEYLAGLALGEDPFAYAPYEL